MGHYAQIDSNNIVVNVIVAKGDIVNTGIFGDSSKWIKTSYNTQAGVHYTPNKAVDGQYVPDGGIALRKNYAGIGYTYDKDRDAFIPPKPFPSWVLDEDKCIWKDPVEGRFTQSVDPTWDDSKPIQEYKNWKWDEDNQEWVILEYPKWIGTTEDGDWERNEDGSVKG
jgi:hypothetical protein